MMTKMIQATFAHPEASRRRKMSPKTMNRSQIQMKKAKKISIVQKTSSSG